MADKKKTKVPITITATDKRKLLPGDISCYRARVIADKLGISIEKARAMKRGESVEVSPAKKEVTDGR